MIVTLLSNNLVAQESDAVALLERMSQHIAKLDTFVVSGDSYADARLSEGLMIEHSSEVTMRIMKPGAMRMTMRNSEETKELLFHDGLLTLYTGKHNFFAQAEVPKNIAAAADFAINEFGINAPLLDFVSNDMAEELKESADEIQHLGTSLIRGVVHDHISIRTSDVDIQLWIASDGPPLPGKMSITSKWEGGSPRFVTFFTWDTNPSFAVEALNWVPPAGATQIEFVREAD